MEDIHYKLLKVLQANPDFSQRQLAQELGISLGKANFRYSTNKVAYAYLLTPHGIEEKARATVSFLRRKVAEHEALASEIEQLRNEARQGRINADEPTKA